MVLYILVGDCLVYRSAHKTVTYSITFDFHTIRKFAAINSVIVNPMAYPSNSPLVAILSPIRTP
jgi:hypothetical protein